jgi:hypothetical protein
MWQDGNWTRLGPSGLNQHVYALARLPDGTLVAGGAFTMAGSLLVNRVAAWVTPPECQADLNRDSLVDDADFVIFAANYERLICTDSEMPIGCPSDLNGDGTVDDADFVQFAAAYGDLVCP